MNRLVDPNLGLNDQALAALHMLAAREDQFHERGEFWTYAMYNGRERGFCIVARKSGPNTFNSFNSNVALHIFVAESRSSDTVFVQNWLAPFAGLDTPGLPTDGGRVDQESYAARREFAYGRIDQVVEAVISDFEKFFEVSRFGEEPTADDA